jgi:hypothetical protein
VGRWAGRRKSRCCARPWYVTYLTRGFGNKPLACLGWTTIENAYLLNGTIFIVVDRAEGLPDRPMVVSNGLRIEAGEQAAQERLPSDDDLRIITPKEARTLFSTPSAEMLGGTTVGTSLPRLVTIER